MSASSNSYLLAAARVTTWIAGLLIVAIGCLVLAGWIFDLTVLKSVSAHWVTMKANTAVAFMFAGLSLLLLQTEPAVSSVMSQFGRARLLGQVAALLVTLIGGLTLAEYTVGRNFGLDQLLFRESSNAIGTFSPGRMAPVTAVSLVITGLALLLLEVQTRNGWRPAQLLVLIVMPVSLLALVGYLYGVNELIGPASTTYMALPTALALLALCVGLLTSRPERGIMALFTGAGGVLARRLLPVAIGVPLLMGWLRLLGQRLGWFDSEVGTALVVVSSMEIFAIVVWLNALMLTRADASRRQAEIIRHESEERLSLALAASGVGTWHWKLASDTITWDPHICRLFGLKPEDAPRSYDAVMPLIHASDRERVGDEVTRSLKDKDDYQSEFRVIWPDGSLHWLLSRGKVYRDAGGQAMRMTGVCWDITERREAEECLERQAQELTRSNSELEQFAYVASHDLQEPLRMVASYTQLLARRYQGKLDGDADRFIGHAVNGALRMQALINDLLTLSRVGRKGEPFLPTDCNAAVDQAIANLTGAIEDNQAQVSHDSLPTVTADGRQLTQLFQNLISNAVKFRKKDETPCIHVAAAAQDDKWVFSVRDNGIGIDPKYHERIFQIFQRLHTREEYPGTGIGLAIFKKIVERHGGILWVESQPGQGSTFYLTIPKNGEPS